MKVRRALVGLLICWSWGVAFADTWQYTIRPGDDLWTLAKNYCGSSNLAPNIAQHNNLQNPAALRVGQRIEIPTEWLVFEPSAARAVQVLGEVYIEQTSIQPRIPVKPGDAIDMGATLVTADNAAAQIEFADGSTIAIQANSRVLFNKLTAFGPAGMVDTHLRFSYGRGEVSVKPQNRGDRFRVQTPEGIAAVRGTIFRIGHSASAPDTAGISNSETLTGAISFTQATSQTPVPAGFGVAASATGVTKEELLDPPDVPAYPRVAVDQHLQWTGLPGAAEYVASWIAQTTPEVIYRQTRVDEPATRVIVEPGAYELRIRGVSSSRIEGFDHVQTVVVARSSPTMTPISRPFSAGMANLEWIDSTPSGPYTVTVQGERLDEPVIRTVSTKRLELPLSPGHYTWTVASSDSVPSQPASFTILPAQPTGLTASVDRNAEGNRVDLRWSAQSADQFTLEVVQPHTADVVYKQVVSGSAHQFNLNDYGHFMIRLTAQQNELQSETATTQVRLYRRPWWLLVLLIPVAAL